MTTIHNFLKNLFGTQMFRLQCNLFIDTHVKGTSRTASETDRNVTEALPRPCQQLQSLSLQGHTCLLRLPRKPTRPSIPFPATGSHPASSGMFWELPTARGPMVPLRLNCVRSVRPALPLTATGPSVSIHPDRTMLHRASQKRHNGHCEEGGRRAAGAPAPIPPWAAWLGSAPKRGLEVSVREGWKGRRSTGSGTEAEDCSPSPLMY